VAASETLVENMVGGKKEGGGATICRAEKRKGINREDGSNIKAARKDCFSLKK